MGRASTSKKVSRAASTGGGRTARGAKPLVWYGVITLVVALGFAGIFFSRAERREELAVSADNSAPAPGKDHWHAAYGVYLCDKFAPAITDERDPKGIHTHGDGVIHIHPTVRSAAGRNATLGVFADAVRMTLTDEEIRLPRGKSYKEGSTKCGGKPGVVQVSINGDEVVTENVRGIKFTDSQLLTIAFAPEGTKLPTTPSERQLGNLDDVPRKPTAPVPTPPPGEGTTDDPAPADDPATTSQPGDSSPATTAAP